MFYGNNTRTIYICRFKLALENPNNQRPDDWTTLTITIDDIEDITFLKNGFWLTEDFNLCLEEGQHAYYVLPHNIISIHKQTIPTNFSQDNNNE